MKKSKKIQLVLITAALSSCSRVIIPNEPLQNCLADTSLANTPVDWDAYETAAAVPSYQINYEPIWYHSFFYLRPAYAHPDWSPLVHPGMWYRPPVSWNGGAAVVRGGFGVSAKTVTISS